MTVTWKRWVCFLLVALGTGTMCHFSARRYLVDFEAFSTMSGATCGGTDCELAEQAKWYERPGCAALEITYVPWPIQPLLPEPTPPSIDPQHPATRDAEALMGLALLARTPLFDVLPESDAEPPGGAADGSAGFERLSRQAIAAAEDPKLRRRLRQIALYTAADIVEPHFMRRFLGQTPTAPSTGPGEPVEALQERFEARVLAQAEEIDPSNALYAYRRAHGQARRMVADRKDAKPLATSLPSRASAQDHELVDAGRLLPGVAELDAVLTHAEDDCAINHFRAYRAELQRKAVRAVADLRKPVKALGLHALGLSFYPSIRSGSMLRDLTRRLCFLGDRLAERGQDELALRMYRHAYRVGERLMTEHRGGTLLIEALVGQACAGLANAHLLEFWAQRTAPSKVLEAGTFSRHLQDLLAREREMLARKKADPLGHNETAFVRYVRAAGLTWWLGASGMAMAAFSMIAAAAYLLFGRRERVGEPALRIPQRVLALGIVLPIGLMIFLALLIPLQLEGLDKAGPVLLWAYALTIVWAVCLGLLARRAAPAGEQAAAPPTGWLWPATALAALAAGVLATIFAARPVAAAAGLSGGVIALGVLTWAVLSVVGWFRRRAPADRAYRARAGKAFAVCAMLAASAALLAALISVPLTRHHQSSYFQKTLADADREAAIYLGEDWPASFRGLSREVFTLAEPSTRPAATAPGP